jgi:hypothetical protein
MRSKKASWVGFVLHPTFETAIALGFVLLYLLWFIHGIGERATFEKKFISNDLPLLVDSILAMPQKGNLYAFYFPQKTAEFSTNYSFKFTKNTVTISVGENDLKAVSGYYTSDPEISIEEKDLKHTDAMVVPVFVKQGSKISIDNLNRRTFVYNRNIISCNDEPFTGRLQLAGNNTVEQLLLGQPWAEKSGGDGVLAVVLSQGEKTIVRAYVNAESGAKSQRIACEAANAVVREMAGVEFEGSAVIPVNPKHTARTDDDFLQGTGVLIEIQSPSPIAEQSALATAIATGVKNAKS